jgi:ABC-type transporter Mla subunit MlaD
MTPEPIDPPSPQRRALSLVGRALRYLLFRIRATLALLAQSLQRDELRELRTESQALGSAASESISHVGAELREINERLSALERDIDRLGRLLEQQGTADATSGKQRQALSRD